MGARADSIAYAKAEIGVSPAHPSVLDRVVVRLAIEREGNLSIVGDGEFDGRIASMWVELDETEDRPSNYFVVAWSDENGDYRLSPEERYTICDGFYTVVSQRHYDTDFENLTDKVNLAQLINPLNPYL